MCAEPAPLVWRPMKTCPRRLNGDLKNDVWIAYEWGVIWRRKGMYIGGNEGLSHVGRVGWLPGDIARADLPKVPEVTQ